MINQKDFKEYEKLPQWIQNYLGLKHHHLVINDYGAPKKDTAEYDEWFDKNQELMYTEETVIKLVQALLKEEKEKFEILELHLKNTLNLTFGVDFANGKDFTVEKRLF